MPSRPHPVPAPAGHGAQSGWPQRKAQARAVEHRDTEVSVGIPYVRRHARHGLRRDGIGVARREDQVHVGLVHVGVTVRVAHDGVDLAPLAAAVEIDQVAVVALLAVVDDGVAAGLDVAGVAHAVFVGVTLIEVRDLRAVVHRVRNAVHVLVGHRHGDVPLLTGGIGRTIGEVTQVPWTARRCPSASSRPDSARKAALQSSPRRRRCSGSRAAGPRSHAGAAALAVAERVASAAVVDLPDDLSLSGAHVPELDQGVVPIAVEVQVFVLLHLVREEAQVRRFGEHPIRPTRSQACRSHGVTWRFAATKRPWSRS